MVSAEVSLVKTEAQPAVTLHTTAALLRPAARDRISGTGSAYLNQLAPMSRQHQLATRVHSQVCVVCSLHISLCLMQATLHGLLFWRCIHRLQGAPSCGLSCTMTCIQHKFSTCKDCTGCQTSYKIMLCCVALSANVCLDVA